jgi:hypothetical protein
MDATLKRRCWHQMPIKMHGFYQFVTVKIESPLSPFPLVAFIPQMVIKGFKADA